MQPKKDGIKDRSKSHLSLEEGQECHLGLGSCTNTKQRPNAGGGARKSLTQDPAHNTRENLAAMGN